MRSAILANFFVAKSAEMGADLSALQLHKLVYFAHAWHLGYLSKPLIDEVVQAWQYGPAIPALHRDLEVYGRDPMTGFVGSGTAPSGFGSSQAWPETDSLRIAETVWRQHWDLSGKQLSVMASAAGTPWDVVANKNRGLLEPASGPIIANRLIRLHHEGLIRIIDPEVAQDLSSRA